MSDEYKYTPKDDLTGQRFGRLVVKGINQEESKKKHRTIYICECDCGKIKDKIAGYTLKSGATISCGCERNNRIKMLNVKHNTYKFCGEYIIVYTDTTDNAKTSFDQYGRNYFYIDTEDYDKIKDYYWRFDIHGYVCTSQGTRLHRIIMNLEKEDERVVDHILGEKTLNDNRKSNLRIATFQENCRNKRLKKDNKSGVTGVHYHISNHRWVATITIDQKQINLGSYKTFEEAVQARKQYEYKVFGEFSYDISQRIKR